MPSRPKADLLIDQHDIGCRSGEPAARSGGYSEQIPHYLLSDSSQLERFVEDELVDGLRKAVETEESAGAGPGSTSPASSRHRGS